MLGALLLVTGCRAREAPPPPAAAAPPASVLLVTVDTLRADRLGAYGDAEARTPVLDALAREGVLFERAFTPVPLTLPAHATLLTGLLPPAHGVRVNGAHVLREGIPTLAEALRARGRATAAFVGGFPVAARFGLARGFDHYDDHVEKAPGLHFDLAERPATAVVAAARAWLAAHAGPVFVWLHVFDPHAPYAPPAAFRHRDPYRGEIAAVDAALGPLLAAWKARPDPSLVAVTSDHGEAFGEHGEESHSLFVYDTTLRVPLVLAGTGIAPGRRAGAVSIADLAATLLARVAGDGPRLPGRDLLGPAAAPDGLYAETLAPQHDFGWSGLRAWRQGRFKYVRAPRPELYDLQADPDETTDVAARLPGPLADLSAGLDRALAAMGERETAARVDAGAAERLRALGYVQGPGGRGSGADPKDMLPVARKIAAAVGPFPTPLDAARAYAEIVALDRDNPLVNLRLADALLRAGRPGQAVPYYDHVVRRGPRTADAHVGLATALLALGRADAAGRALEEGLAVDPGNGQLHYNLGELARAAARRDEARRRYEAALRDPVTRARAEARLREVP